MFFILSYDDILHSESTDTLNELNLIMIVPCYFGNFVTQNFVESSTKTHLI